MTYVQLVRSRARRRMLLPRRCRPIFLGAIAIAGLLSGLPAFAQEITMAQQTSGTLSSVPVPSGWQFQYDPFADSTVLFEPDRNQLFLFSWFAMDPAAALTDLLVELGGQAYLRDVRAVRFAGYEGAEVRVDAGGGSVDWFLALERDGMLLGVWAKTAGSFENLAPLLSAIVSGTTVAPAQWPQNVAGRYQTESTHSGGVTGSIFVQSYTTLNPDGSVVRSGNIAGSTSGGSVLGQSRTGGARWEVRGDRLLIITEDGELISKRLEGVYSNGLSFHGPGPGSRLEHWVRQ